MVTPEQRAILATASAVAPRPALGAIWAALEGVPDPEIPVVSVIELGMVRGVEWSADDPDTLVVRITPTYSGCPATEPIAAAIVEALATIGVAHVALEMQLSPPWTTEWITPEAKRKLREYGIAPPAGRAPAGAGGSVSIAPTIPVRRPPAAVACPRCGATQTELVAQFGSTPCKAQYRCLECREPFDYFKPY